VRPRGTEEVEGLAVPPLSRQNPTFTLTHLLVDVVPQMHHVHVHLCLRRRQRRRCVRAPHPATSSYTYDDVASHTLNPQGLTRLALRLSEEPRVRCCTPSTSQAHDVRCPCCAPMYV